MGVTFNLNHVGRLVTELWRQVKIICYICVVVTSRRKAAVRLCSPAVDLMDQVTTPQVVASPVRQRIRAVQRGPRVVDDPEYHPGSSTATTAPSCCTSARYGHDLHFWWSLFKKGPPRPCLGWCEYSQLEWGSGVCVDFCGDHNMGLCRMPPPGLLDVVLLTLPILHHVVMCEEAVIDHGLKSIGNTTSPP